VQDFVETSSRPSEKEFRFSEDIFALVQKMADLKMVAWVKEDWKKIKKLIWQTLNSSGEAKVNTRPQTSGLVFLPCRSRILEQARLFKEHTKRDFFFFPLPQH
jgi:hypothetical protein